MTPCHTNKKRNGRTKRYYYYRCTSTFKKDWNNCNIKQVSSSRIEDYVFINLKRISRDKQHIDSLIFKLNHSLPGNHTGCEASKELIYSLIFSPEIFIQTLQNFTNILREKKGIEKSLWIKKFIKRIDYPRDEIALFLYYKGSKDADYGISASGRAEENAGRNSSMIDFKKGSGMVDWSSSRHVWLPGPCWCENF
ncbi:MAG: hypothetical protein JW770_07940 [Actinobacteria bacterium]|nr:hypothetical protein [Actinomycetota bacterium]